jgi:hypothetical protein
MKSDWKRGRQRKGKSKPEEVVRTKGNVPERERWVGLRRCLAEKERREQEAALQTEREHLHSPNRLLLAWPFLDPICD